MLYADKNHLVPAIEQLRENVSIGDDRQTISVFDSEAVMAGITLEEARERNLDGHFGKSLCNLRYDGTRFELKFHEKVVENTFALSPAGPDAIAAEQATSPELLAPDLKPVIEAIESEYDVISWDFIEVSAASMATGGHFTDFEFTYVISSTEL